jgi:uncharacterized membrane protein YfcA
MEMILIPAVAFAASVLTFFSGFGLGTLLTPVFMSFFSVELAIGMTGLVHLSNSLFKFFLVGTHANRRVILLFGIPAIVGAIVGSYFLFQIPNASPLYAYEAFGTTWSIYPVKLSVSILLCLFALMDLFPKALVFTSSNKTLLLGGVLSGFFGGFSGNQGALRSAFLIKVGLSKEVFVGTTVALSCMVDLTRLSMYSNKLSVEDVQENGVLLTVAVLAAIAGALLGNKLFKKVTIHFIQYFVAVMLLLMSLALGLGFL